MFCLLYKFRGAMNDTWKGQQSLITVTLLKSNLKFNTKLVTILKCQSMSVRPGRINQFLPNITQILKHDVTIFSPMLKDQ